LFQEVDHLKRLLLDCWDQLGHSKRIDR